MKSVCIDTNIIIRHLVDGDPQLNRLLKQHNKTIIPAPIIFETVFVLEKIYQIPRAEIVDNLNAIISAKQIDIDKSIIPETLTIYLNHPKLSIIDSFLVAFSKQTSSQLLTSDKSLQKVFKAYS